MYFGKSVRLMYCWGRETAPLMFVWMQRRRKQLISIFLCCTTNLSTHNLFNKPSQMYNVDNSSIPLNPWPPKVASAEGRKRKTKKVWYYSSWHKGHITCSNAASQTIPPIVIYDDANLNLAWTEEEVPGTKYCLSQMGGSTPSSLKGGVLSTFRICCLCPPFVHVTGWAQNPLPPTGNALCNGAQYNYALYGTAHNS